MPGKEITARFQMPAHSLYDRLLGGALEVDDDVSEKDDIHGLADVESGIHEIEPFEPYLRPERRHDPHQTVAPVPAS